jgi:hypothetical protein
MQTQYHFRQAKITKQYTQKNFHAPIVESVNLYNPGACNTRDLCNESMVLEVLDTKSPAEFRQELFTALTHYYEEILNQDLKMPCWMAAPSPSPSNENLPPSFQRKRRLLRLLVKILRIPVQGRKILKKTCCRGPTAHCGGGSCRYWKGQVRRQG